MYMYLNLGVITYLGCAIVEIKTFLILTALLTVGVK